MHENSQPDNQNQREGSYRRHQLQHGRTASSDAARAPPRQRQGPGSCGLPVPVFPIGGTWLALTWPNRARLAQARVTEDKGRDAAAYPQPAPRNADTQ